MSEMFKNLKEKRKSLRINMLCKKIFNENDRGGRLEDIEVTSSVRIYI